VTPWTQPLRRSFVGLQVFGIYLASGVLFVLTVGAFFLFSLVGVILGRKAPTYPDVAGVVLGGLFGQPLVIVGMVAAVLASISMTWGASRFKAWAHWGAMVLIAASMLPAILMAIAFRDPIYWVIGSIYCGGCVAFLGAMTIALKKYDPWGVPRSI
jgi:hypothetical protein